MNIVNRLSLLLVVFFLVSLAFFAGRKSSEFYPTLASREADLYELLVWFCFSKNTPDFYDESIEKHIRSKSVQEIIKNSRNSELKKAALEAQKILLRTNE